ncbi:MAG: histidine kinase [Candidatus Firestonebacteria bacterium RIFOXYA2_FULL_40_8]|nr:MAG: histidine kinase [Candidatus Firestonebacteria bacterium RIFOXYA2_FULL_40_8]
MFGDGEAEKQEGVFDRKTIEDGAQELSGGTYNLIMGLVLTYGFLINWLMVKFVPADKIVADIGPIFFLLAYFGLCFLGIYLFKKSSNPAVSFLGYNLVVVPFGFIINIVVMRYDPAIVLEAMKITGLVTASMMILGTLFPAFFKKIAPALTISLLLVIIWELVDIFILKKTHGIIDWIVVLIFCGYIGYDWGRANQIPKTLDNAIDSAAALYMDIINLFLRILRILGRRR